LRKIITAIVVFILTLSMFQVFVVRAELPETEYWAFIVCGSPVSDPTYPPSTFTKNTEYMLHTLTEDYDFDEIIYFDNVMKSTVRRTITRTLAGLSDENDVIFMYFASHGNGKTWGRYDDPTVNMTGEYPDEGDEIRESTLGYDMNGDGDTDDWVGFDENMEISHIYAQTGEYITEFYWDDELAEDLNHLEYKKLIFVRQGCFSGGLIDDIGDSNRIIMTVTNETWTSLGDLDGDGFSEWSEVFIDALHGNDTSYVRGQIVDQGVADADINDDGHVSMLEAWEYAWDNDDARLRGDEDPWMDDNGDGYPTYKNETDQFVPGDGIPSGLAANTWLPEKGGPRRRCHDRGNVNYPGSYFHWTYIELGYGIDLQVDQTDIDLMSLAYGMFSWEPWGVGEGLYNPDADINQDGIVDARDISLACWYYGTSCEEYWDGYKYSKKTTGSKIEEVIDFYNRTDFMVYLGQEKYVNGEKVSDTYNVSDWDPAWAFPIGNSTKGKTYFEDGWFFFGP
jgi:hypothetical protein